MSERPSEVPDDDVRIASGLKARLGAEIAGGAVAAAGHDQTHSSDSAGSSHHYSTPKRYESAQDLRAALAASGRIRIQATQGRTPMPVSVRWSVQVDGDHGQTHSESGHAEMIQGDEVMRGLKAALEKAVAGAGPQGATGASFARAGARQAGIRAGLGAAEDPHGQTHSSGGGGGGGGGGSEMASSARQRAGLGRTADLSSEMHDQTHSEGGGGRDEMLAGGIAAAARDLASDMHDQTHSSGGGGGSIGQLGRFGQPQGATSRFAAGSRRSLAELGGDVMHDQTHSSGGGGRMERFATDAARSQLRDLASEMHDQTHSEGGHGGGSREQLGRIAGPQGASRRMSSPGDVMHDQTHSEGRHRDDLAEGARNERVSRSFGPALDQDIQRRG